MTFEKIESDGGENLVSSIPYGLVYIDTFAYRDVRLFYWFNEHDELPHTVLKLEEEFSDIDSTLAFTIQ